MMVRRVSAGQTKGPGQQSWALRDGAKAPEAPASGLGRGS